MIRPSGVYASPGGISLPGRTPEGRKHHEDRLVHQDHSDDHRGVPRVDVRPIGGRDGARPGARAGAVAARRAWSPLPAQPVVVVGWGRLNPAVPGGMEIDWSDPAAARLRAVAAGAARAPIRGSIRFACGSRARRRCRSASTPFAAAQRGIRSGRKSRRILRSASPASASADLSQFCLTCGRDWEVVRDTIRRPFPDSRGATE